MAKQFLLGGKKVASVFCALSTALFLMTGCDEKAAAPHENANGKDVALPVGGPGLGVVDPGIDVPPPPPIVEGPAAWSTIELLARTDPADPHNERFLDDWVFRLYTIDDHARPTSPIFSGESGPGGGAIIGLPGYMFQLPLVVEAYNEAFPVDCPENETLTSPGIMAEDETDCTCRTLDIFVPPYCHDKLVWLAGPFEAALWDFYEEAAQRGGEAWNPSQVDCGTWIANLQALILTDEIIDELNEISDREDMTFNSAELITALQENAQFLTPTRPPICMAERRHNGGGMERSELIPALPVTIDDFVAPFETEVAPDSDPIIIGTNGVVDSICGIPLVGNLAVNTINFVPQLSYFLDDSDFMGTIHDQEDIVGNIDVALYNTRLGNGRELDHDKYDDACALTSIIEFTNKDDDEQDLLGDTGVTFTDLFGAANATVYLTSDGDDVVDDNDYWAIFHNSATDLKTATVLAVELLGHRQGDFRDVLHLTFDVATDNLFIGLRADYEANEEEVDGERAFLAYTLHTWDGSTVSGQEAARENISNCYEAADVWARQFFVTEDFQIRAEECCVGGECELDWLIPPLVAAEFAVREALRTNSRANQRWRTEASGFWSINTEHGVHGNIIVNPGWLAPDMDYEIFIQKFDEAVFKGPRTVRRTDDVGQLMAELPTLVEGDRVLLKAEDNCCDDYDLVIPCLPEFTGFAGQPGIPFVPATLGPPPPPGAVPVPVPVAVP